MLAHEFLRKPRWRDYPYDLCFDLLEGAIGHHVLRGRDPWRWTSDDVADLLSSWFPSPPLDSPERLRYLPDLIGDFVMFVQRDRAPAEVSAEISATIDRMRPEFLCAVGAFGWRTPPFSSHEPAEPAHPLQDIADLVGGFDALGSLDAAPLPDEPLDWGRVPGRSMSRVRELAPWLDACADRLLTVEHRTAMRRFVVELARRDPRPLRRGTPPRRAATIAWVVLQANDDIGPGRDRLLTGADLMAAFELSTSVSGPGRTMLRAAGGSERPHLPLVTRFCLGDPDLLTSRRRERIIVDRDCRGGLTEWPSPRPGFLD